MAKTVTWASMKKNNLKIQRIVTLLGAFNRALSSAHCEQDLFDAICHLMTTTGGYRMAWLGLAYHDTAKTVLPVAQAGFVRGYLHIIRISWDEHNPLGQGPTGKAIRSGKPQVVQDTHYDSNYEPWRKAALERGYVAVAAFPIVYDGKVSGSLNLYSDTCHSFDDNEILFLDELTKNLAYALHKLSERREGEIALHRSRELYRRLVEDMPLMLCRYDPDTHLRFVNRAYCDYFGKSSQELEGLSFSQFIPESEWAGLQKYIASFSPEIPIQISEHPIHTPDGDIRWQRWVDRAFFDDQYHVLEFQSIGEDITAQKYAEIALEESREQFRLAFDNANIGIVLMSLEGQLLRVNPCFAAMLGYQIKDLEGINILTLTHPDDHAYSADIFCQFRDGMNQYHCEKRYLHANGTAVWAQIVSSHAHNVKGGTPYLISHVLDISERKHNERQLQRLATIVEQATASIVLTDLNGTIVYANPYFEIATGYSQQEALGQNPRILHSGCQDKTFYTHLWNELTQGKTWSGRFINRRKDGSLYHEAASLFPIKDKKGTIINYAAVKRDITEQVEAEHALKAERAQLAQRVAERTAELRHSNAELARAVRLKDEFLANMSHELRTPLNAILTLTEVLEESLEVHLTAKQQQYFKTVRDSGAHLLSLISDILDISKIEAGRMELNIQPVDVKIVCESSLNLVRQLAAKKELQLEFSLDLATEMNEIYADARRLKQMLVNLLSNAIKFTPEGGKIILSAAMDYAYKNLVLKVCDNGIGIATDDIKRLFEPFTQIDGGLDRQYAGTGLGLTLVSRMIVLHGGRIEVSSTLGKGSCFSLYLPWKENTAHTPPENRTEEQHVVGDFFILGPKKHVLLVDDTPHVLDLFSDYLSKKGLHISCARSGQEALDTAATLAPDLILMDINMPDMDGIEATRRLRQYPHLQQTPIIALTALAMEGDRERCLAAGMQEYLSKPVQLKQLVATLRHYLNLC
jgi:two-component system, sensor histidine kinase and response regulator